MTFMIFHNLHLQSMNLDISYKYVLFFFSSADPFCAFIQYERKMVLVPSWCRSHQHWLWSDFASSRLFRSWICSPHKNWLPNNWLNSIGKTILIWTLDGKALPWVSSAKHLGCKLTSDIHGLLKDVIEKRANIRRLILQLDDINVDWRVAMTSEILNVRSSHLYIGFTQPQMDTILEYLTTTRHIREKDYIKLILVWMNRLS